MLRFGRLTDEEWQLGAVREKDVARSYPKYDQTVMFPSTHDITEDNFEACKTVLGKLLKAGNRVLVVSKPRPELIEKLCQEFEDYKGQILFRFTIGTNSETILQFWEPNAPAYEERRDPLKYAYKAGFETSVSVEPMLGADNVVELVRDLEKFVTNSIWIGKMNHLKKNIALVDDEIREVVRVIEDGQSDENIVRIYNALKYNPLVRWKDSIKKVVGIEPPSEAGLDI